MALVVVAEWDYPLHSRIVILTLLGTSLGNTLEVKYSLWCPFRKMQTGKEEVKLPLLVNLLVYIKSLTESIKELLRAKECVQQAFRIKDISEGANYPLSQTLSQLSQHFSSLFSNVANVLRNSHSMISSFIPLIYRSKYKIKKVFQTVDCS